MFRIFIFAGLLLINMSLAHAEQIKVDPKALENSGFVGISELLEQMSPEQRKVVMELAEQKLKELEALPAEDVKILYIEALKKALFIDYDKVDAKALVPTSTSKKK